jgi:hypothetical protein
MKVFVAWKTGLSKPYYCNSLSQTDTTIFITMHDDRVKVFPKSELVSVEISDF